MPRASCSSALRLAAASARRALAEVSAASALLEAEAAAGTNASSLLRGNATPPFGVRLLSSFGGAPPLNLHRRHRPAANASACPRCGSRMTSSERRCSSCCSCRSVATAAAPSPSTSASILSPSSLSTPRSLRRRSFRSSPLPASTDVTVASMGESITEGTVATVLKSVGDAVAADDVIAQIETDKVTIDVRSPVSGSICSVDVREGDNVVVGQLVAKVEEGEVGEANRGTAKPAAAPPPPPAAAAAPPPPPAAAARPPPPPPAPRPAKKQPQSRKPSISFPPRVTRAGVRISSLPAGDALAAVAAARAASEVLEGPELAERLSRGRPASSSTTIPLYVGTERGTKLSASRVLTDREMEMIELGGVEP